MTFYVLFIIAIAAGTGTGSILIKEDSNKSYIYHQIADRDMVMFPEKLQIKIYPTKLPGLLFYEFYKTYDVVGILGEKDIKLTFQGQQYNTSLQKLCKCDPCLYQSLTFTFEINDNITVDCNGNKVVKKKLPSKMNGHLIHSFKYLPRNENAHFYLINIPPFINHTYHYEKLGGCIQEMKYRDISFEEDINNIDTFKKCIPHCTETKCNGGKCLETFDDPPLCDCQFMFLNGDNCKSELAHGFNASVNFQFEVLKLSWLSSEEEILLVSNISHSIKVNHKDKSLRVSFVGREQDNSITIEKNYSPTEQHILIISIDKKIGNISYKSQTMDSWINISTLLSDSVFDEKYSSITFLNNKYTEKGDLVYKINRFDYKWLDFRNILQRPKDKYLTKLELGFGYLFGLLVIAAGTLFIIRVKNNVTQVKNNIVGGVFFIVLGIYYTTHGIFLILWGTLYTALGIYFIAIGIAVIAIGIVAINSKVIDEVSQSRVKPKSVDEKDTIPKDDNEELLAVEMQALKDL